MKQLVRSHTFETNSSSTHSLTIMTEDQFDQFRDGNLFYDDWKEKFYTYEELKERMLETTTLEEVKNDYIDYYGEEESDFNSPEEFEKHVVAYWAKENDIRDYDHMLGDQQEDYETFEQHYTSPSGDKIVVCGYYGYA